MRATGMLEAERRFRRIIGHQSAPPAARRSTTSGTSSSNPGSGITSHRRLTCPTLRCGPLRTTINIDDELLRSCSVSW
jgi:hypothetical protein